MSAFSSTNDPCGAASPAAFDCMNDFEQQTLFSGLEESTSLPPLAERMRPRTLDEFVGQERLLGPGRLLRRAIEADRLQSSIFWGPPGCGKTTLASIIARMTGSAFEKLNAVTSGVADVRQVLKEAQDRRLRYGRATYLLLDECHRWSKAQSDSILPAIESGLIRFIGSTTENPMVSMTPAIVSRCRVFQFEPLQTQDVLRVLQNALCDPERGYGGSDVRAEDGALAYIARMSGGDVRTALGALELAWLTTAGETDPSTGRPFKRLTLETAQESVQKPLLKMDEGQYYDMLSAFIKSMRGSDPDAALFWFSRLLYAGVDPRLIVRRIVVHASEDVGLADPSGHAAGAGRRHGAGICGHAGGAHPHRAGHHRRLSGGEEQQRVHGHRRRHGGRPEGRTGPRAPVPARSKLCNAARPNAAVQIPARLPRTFCEAGLYAAGL